MICEILKNLELAEHEKVQFCARFFELGYAGLDFRESKAKEVRTKRFHLQTSALIQPRASSSKFVTMALHLTISDLDSFFTTHISMIQHLDILVCTMVFWRRIFRILVSFGLLQGFRCLYACTQNAILLQKRSFWNSWLHRAHMFEAGEQVPSSTSWFLRRFLFLFRLRVSRGVSFCYALCVLTSVFLFFSLLSPSWVFA